jgi:hypothetical protein
MAYKIMAKALALQLCLASEYAVWQEKTNFVQGRFILDTVILAWEVMVWAWEAMEWVREIGQH